MRIATLQLDFRLGDVEGNLEKTDRYLRLQRQNLDDLDLLVLPELAFTGR